MHSDIGIVNRLKIASDGFDNVNPYQQGRNNIEHIFFFFDEHIINQRLHNMRRSCCGGNGEKYSDKNHRVLKFIPFYIGPVSLIDFAEFQSRISQKVPFAVSMIEIPIALSSSRTASEVAKSLAFLASERFSTKSSIFALLASSNPNWKYLNRFCPPNPNTVSMVDKDERRF